MSFFSKFINLKKNENDEVIEHNSAEVVHVYQARNWYYDRYETLVVQRNVLFLISVLSIIASCVCVFFIGKVTLSKTVEPMVIEIEDKTGITNIVNPFTDKRWTSDRAISEYFLIMYLKARETYNIVDYNYNYSTVVRLFSNTAVYNQFKDIVNNPTTNPITKYAANNSTILTVRSVQFLEDSPSGDHNVQVRFAITETSGSKKQYNKIASVLWNYTQMQMTFDERMINPLGFQVKFYTVSDDVS
jgi:type IV secretion system protein VirB8